MFFDQRKLDFGFALKETFFLRAQDRFHSPDHRATPVIGMGAGAGL
jgi:hypothetical protein